ncbi:flagellar filament capping protein FliD [Heliobacterium gestii]|uniref:Flagellar hook-associated protein 2 n=1 Tax=Heliomicrobium gestii TaxID=2699 RepID=A0A845LF22_HELGE|nr:flagellar filament capping protein FliD [Heliomicrobium gestii]MBM7866675.1 flagellar hook-associated protein 2 [Heliomicrobium gestii]MZP43045.1 flagellar filament capping protein FliD [Heliomicrobium gestii]
MSNLQISGLVSGIDTKGIIDKLMAVESQPLVQMERQKKILQFRKDAFFEFKLKMNSLRDKAETLYRNTGFSATTGTTSDTSVATVKTGTNAVAGTYNLDVTTLATNARISGKESMMGVLAATNAALTGSSAVAAADSSVKFSDFAASNSLSNVQSGQFTINGVSITVVKGADTVNSVLNKINDSNAGVTASINSSNQIVLTQKTAGKSQTITLGSDSSGFLAATGLNSGTARTGQDSPELRTLDSINTDPDYAGTGTIFTGGFFKINGYTISYSTSDTVQSILNKINNGATGVTAFYDRNKGQISFTSEQTGANQQIVLDEPGGAGAHGNFLHAMLGADASKNMADGAFDWATDAPNAKKVAGTDATFKINGADMKSSNNTVSFNGMDISLLKQGATTTITVNPDLDKVTQNIHDFVDKYNETVDYLYNKLGEKSYLYHASGQDANTNPTDDELKTGLLKSQSIVRDAYDQLRRMASGSVIGLPDEMNSLSDIGITGKKYSEDGGKSGQLTIDDDKLKAALRSNFNGVMSLFQQKQVQVADYTLTTTPGTTEYKLPKTGITYGSLPTQLVSGSEQFSFIDGTPGDHQYTVDWNNGIVKFGSDPGALTFSNLYFTYNPKTEYTAGLATRIRFYTTDTTKTGGSLDAITGSSGSIEKELKVVNTDMDNLQRRLEQKRKSYEQRFTAMETALSKIKSQTSALASL